MNDSAFGGKTTSGGRILTAEDIIPPQNNISQVPKATLSFSSSSYSPLSSSSRFPFSTLFSFTPSSPVSSRIAHHKTTSAASSWSSSPTYSHLLSVTCSYACHRRTLPIEKVTSMTFIFLHCAIFAVSPSTSMALGMILHRGERMDGWTGG